MKRVIIALVLAVALAAGAAVHAQQGAQNVPPGATPIALASLPALTSANATAAVNNTATLTITPPPGQFVYLCGLDLIVANDATGAVAATNLSFTSTNIGGWAYKYSMVGTANTNGVDRSFLFWPCVKSAAPTTAVTIVSPAINLHATYSINGYYYFGY